MDDQDWGKLPSDLPKAEKLNQIGGYASRSDLFLPRPEILMHPNIPKPLHGVNPRTIMGDAWWDVTRKEAYAKTGYRCAACGVHKSRAKGKQWLEAHEFYDVDWINARVTIKEIVALCHYCHNFIHSGRLGQMYMKGEAHRNYCVAVLNHGFDILKVAGLPCFEGTKLVAEDILNIKCPVTAYFVPENESHWSLWRLVFEGKEYEPIHKTFSDWKRFYSVK